MLYSPDSRLLLVGRLSVAETISIAVLCLFKLLIDLDLRLESGTYRDNYLF